MRAGKIYTVFRYFGDACESRLVTLCFLGMGGLGFGLILAVAGAGAVLIGLLAGVYLAVVLLWLLAVGLLEGRRMEALEKLIRDLPEVWLLGEVLPKPVGALERRYFRIMLELSRCAVGVAEEARREKEAYCDYVERWIHEMKTPLTACSLILDNGGDGRKQ